MTVAQRSTVRALQKSEWQLLPESDLLSGALRPVHEATQRAEDLVQDEQTPEPLREALAQLALGEWEALVVSPNGGRSSVVSDAWAVKEVSTKGYSVPNAVEAELVAQAEGDPMLLSVLRTERKRTHFGLNAGAGERPNDTTHVHVSPGLVFVAYSPPAVFGADYERQALRSAMNMQAEAEVLLVRKRLPNAVVTAETQPDIGGDAKLLRKMWQARPLKQRRKPHTEAVWQAYRGLRSMETGDPKPAQLKEWLVASGAYRRHDSKAGVLVDVKTGEEISNNAIEKTKQQARDEWAAFDLPMRPLQPNPRKDPAVGPP